MRRFASALAIVSLALLPLAANAQASPAPGPTPTLPPPPSTSGKVPTEQTVQDKQAGYSTTSTTTTPGVEQATPPPTYLPNPPQTGNPFPTQNLLIDALNAVERAQVTNPDASLTAAATYTQAVGRYLASDDPGARAAAAQAIAEAAVPSLVDVYSAAPAPALIVHATQHPFTWTDTPTTDADSYLGLARESLATCAATGSALTAAQQSFASAQAAVAAHRPIDARTASIATINACAGGDSQPVAL
jgi:hypothetical protein